MQFFMPLERIPTVTHQQGSRSAIVKGKIVHYKSTEYEEAIGILLGALSQHRPDKPIEPPVELTTLWYFGTKNKNRNMMLKITKPDEDNLVKGFRDCLERLKFVKCDQHIAVSHTWRFWTTGVPGIYVDIKKVNEYGDGIETISDGSGNLYI